VALLVAGAVSAALSLPFLYGAVTRPDLRALVLRNMSCRSGQAALVVTGIAIATAIVTSANVAGDSLRASVRRSVDAQLGPVDEELVGVGVHSRPALESAVAQARLDGVADVLPLLSSTATIRGRDFVARVAQAHLLEADFARAARFGGGRSATGMSGPTPRGSDAVISADLSAAIAIESGHRITVYAFETSRTFRVSRVLPRRGIAGLATPDSGFNSASLNVFLPPGTMESMLSTARTVSSQAMPLAILAISNSTRVSDDRNGRDAVAAELRRATRGLDAEVRPVRQQLLDDAEARSRQFTALFRAFGAFSAIGGVLLLVLTFLIVARDSARSMAILRAQGMTMRSMAGALALEGWGYALAGIAVGAAAGVGMGFVVVLLARDVLVTRTAGGVDLIAAARVSSVVQSCMVVLGVSLIVVVLTSVLAARRNVVRLIRGLADPPSEPSRRVLAGAGAALCAAGIALAAIGVIVTNAIAIVAGPAAVAAGIVLILYTPSRAPALVLVACVDTLAWAVLAVNVVPRAFTGLDIAVVIVEGVVTTGCALTLANAVRRLLTRAVLAGSPPRALPIVLGLAYAATARRRTFLITTMYAVVVFTISLLVTVAHLYAGDVAALGRRLSAGADLEVTSNPAQPVSPNDVARLPGVVGVTPVAALNAEVRTGHAVAPLGVTVMGIDAGFVGHGAPPLTEPGTRNGSDVDAYRTVVRDPSTLIVGRDLRADRQSGLSKGALRVGDVVQLRNPTTGRARSLIVAGIAAAARYAGTDHIYVARSLVDELAGGPTATNVLFVATRPDVNPDVLAAIIDGTHLPNGTYARSFKALARESLSAQRQFLDLSAGYAAVGLVAVLAGISVLMVDRVRERRQQISLLRALGFSRVTVRRSYAIEAATIALEGTVTGVLTGCLVAWRLAARGSLGQPLAFSAPVLPLLAIVAALLAATLAATLVAARQAGRLRPALALRGAE